MLKNIFFKSCIYTVLVFLVLQGVLLLLGIELGLGGVSTQQRILIVNAALIGLTFSWILALMKGKALAFNLLFLLFTFTFVEGIIIEKGNGIGIRKKAEVNTPKNLVTNDLPKKDKAESKGTNKNSKLVANIQSSIPDPLLGYNLKPGNYLVRKSCYEVVYSNTKDSIRVNPFQNETTKLATLFGCSFTYGTGLNDNQSLAANLAQYDSSRNYMTIAQEGYGIQQMLVNLEERPKYNSFLKESLAQADLGIYFYLEDHIYRLLGKNHIITYHWGKDFPFYDIDTKSGNVKLKGKLGDQISSLQKAFYFPVHVSLIYKKLYFNFFYKGADSIEETDYKKTALAINHAKKQFLKNDPSKRFLVVIFPFTGNNIGTYLEEHNVETLDFSSILSKEQKLEYVLCKADNHPNDKLNKVVSERILEYLAENN